MDDFLKIAPPILQAISVAVTAYFAIQGLRAWRKQLVGKRRFEVAEEAILAANKAFESLEWIRNGAVFGGEADERPKLPYEKDEDARMRDIYWVPLKRIGDSSDQWAELGKVRLLCKIHFGKPASDAVDEFFKIRREVSVASRMLVDGVGKFESAESRAFNEKMRNKIWSVGDETDSFLTRAKDALSQLDEICSPHLK